MVDAHTHTRAQYAVKAPQSSSPEQFEGGLDKKITGISAVATGIAYLKHCGWDDDRDDSRRAEQ